MKEPQKGEIVLVRKHGFVVEDETEFAAIVTKVVPVAAKTGDKDDADAEVTFDIFATVFTPNNFLTERGVIPHQSDTERTGTARWRHRDEEFIEQPYETAGEHSPASAASEDLGYEAQKIAKNDGLPLDT